MKIWLGRGCTPPAFGFSEKDGIGDENLPQVVTSSEKNGKITEFLSFDLGSGTLLWYTLLHKETHKALVTKRSENFTGREKRGRADVGYSGP